ncbi:sulfate ABC transporter substrate-binding protein [Psychrobacter sp. I-STPA10]|uniref:sulfate ABC transporter substrate-binding protein n=1 Tax=Psychrobacter sp. I-STPA10 TaxID=2585769 RepID=UPI001E41B864|nr:sulfate ABC transporter substrate-binding protein [Psychrobacter sp. I-STPA10]
MAQLTIRQLEVIMDKISIKVSQPLLQSFLKTTPTTKTVSHTQHNIKKNGIKYAAISSVCVMMLTLLTACSNNNANSNTTQNGTTDGTTSSNITLLNVSYDVSRDFYKQYNPIFIKNYQQQQADTKINIQQSHGGSSKQALSVANGLQADVVTMNQPPDIDMLVKKGLVKANWQQDFPNDAVPYTSTMVFLVRSGNPKHIHDWNDLTKADVKIVMPNPKTSGTGRYAFLGAYGYGLHKWQANQNNSNDNNDGQSLAVTNTDHFMQQLLANVATYDNGSRAATTTFTQRGVGDVLITTENEAHQVAQNFAKGKVDIVYPSYSIRIDNPVAVVNAVTDKKGTTAAAQKYLAGLWEQAAQNLMAEMYLRPSDPQVLAAHADTLLKIDTFEPTAVFGDWDTIMHTYFADAGRFEQLSKQPPAQ